MKTIDQNPTIADEVLFSFKTTDEDGYLIDPYKVESIKIYFIERDYAGTDQKEYSYTLNENLNVKIDGSLTNGSRVFRCLTTANLSIGMSVIGSGVREGCTVSYIIDNVSLMLSSPAEMTTPNASLIFKKENNTSYSDGFYYKSANCIKTIGDSIFPAWLSTDISNAFIKKSDGIGTFEYVWNPSGFREGDYFVCWSWVPKIGQELFSNNIKFNLKASNFLSTSSPAHHTKPEKYETLLDRYLPEMYKIRLSDSDRSPDVLQKFNQAVAEGFTSVEDIGNQIVDLLDANGVNEYIITYLSNTLDVKLKSQDPTLWRRQIKEAVPLYKKKGTLSSVKESLSQAGMRFLGIQYYWQVVSPYSYQDSFFYTEEDFNNNKKSFILNKRAVEFNNYFKAYFLKYNESNATELPYSELIVDENEYKKTIVTLSENVNLEVGDIIRFKYYYKYPTTEEEKNIDDYINNLQLADSRLEKEIIENTAVLTLPLKNWNVKLIAENDPLINLIISSRHPFVKDLVFGKIRTEFPYSENVYNMDEYNGSQRDSNNPCDIDKDFLDPCSYCRSSVFDIDVEVEKLSNDSISEINNILTENIPFHAFPQTINLYGGQNEFIAPPVENYDVIIDYRTTESVISGAAQQWFYRNKFIKDLKLRDEMAMDELIFTGDLMLFNEKIVLFSNDIDLRNIPLSDNCVLEITSGLNEGVYSVEGKEGNYLIVSDVLEPLNTSEFNFKLYNILYNTTSSITRDDIVELTDNNIVFKDINILSSHKVKLNINGNNYIFDIKEILPNNKLLLTNNNNVISSDIFNKNYSIIDGNANTVASGNCSINHYYRSYLNLNNSILLKNDNNYVNFNVAGTSYFCKIISYSDGGVVYIDGYNGSNAGSINFELRQMLTQSSSGYFSYFGLKALSSINLEQTLNIVNGKNESINKTSGDSFKEDFAILVKTPIDDPFITVNPENNYYFISEIDGDNIWLSGLFENFGVETGTSVMVEIYKFNKIKQHIEENYLNLPSVNISLDRSGLDVSNGDAVMGFMKQKENVTFEILTLDGKQQKGEL